MLTPSPDKEVCGREVSSASEICDVEFDLLRRFAQENPSSTRHLYALTKTLNISPATECRIGARGKHDGGITACMLQGLRN